MYVGDLGKKKKSRLSTPSKRSHPTEKRCEHLRLKKYNKTKAKENSPSDIPNDINMPGSSLCSVVHVPIRQASRHSRDSG